MAQNEIELYHYITNINYRVIFDKGSIFDFINENYNTYTS